MNHDAIILPKASIQADERLANHPSANIYCNDAKDVPQNGLPEDAHGNLPEVARSDLPEVACSNLPEVAYSHLPEVTASVFYQTIGDDLPEVQHSDLPEAIDSTPPELVRPEEQTKRKICRGLCLRAFWVIAFLLGLVIPATVIRGGEGSLASTTDSSSSSLLPTSRLAALNWTDSTGFELRVIYFQVDTNELYRSGQIDSGTWTTARVTGSDIDINRGTPIAANIHWQSEEVKVVRS